MTVRPARAAPDWPMKAIRSLLIADVANEPGIPGPIDNRAPPDQQIERLYGLTPLRMQPNQAPP